MAQVAALGRGPRAGDARAPDGQVGDLPVPARRPEPVRDVRPEDGPPRGHPERHGGGRHALPGVTFGGSFPRLAALADRLTVVRSFVPGDANHDLKPLVGRDTFGANLGSRLRPGRRREPPGDRPPVERRPLPRAVDATTSPATTSFGRFRPPGPLSAADAPYDPSQAGPSAGDLQLAIPRDRLDDRRGCSPGWTASRVASTEPGASTGSTGCASRPTASSRGRWPTPSTWPGRTPGTVARYDTAPLVRPEAIRKNWNNHKNYLDNAKSLGKLLLLARRLCERGCGLRHRDDQLRLGHARRRQQRDDGRGHGLHGPAAGPCAVGVHRRPVRARGSTRRSCWWPAARWGGRRGSTPRGAATTGARWARCCWSAAGFPRGRVIGRSNRDGRRAAVGAGHRATPDRHGLAHPLRRRAAAAGRGPAPRVRPDDGELGPDPRPLRLSRPAGVSADARRRPHARNDPLARRRT